MNIRYGRLFRLPRIIAKEFFSIIYPIIIRIWPLPKVLSIEETIDRINLEKKSICRFGDSEFLYIIDKINLPYQIQDNILRKRLIEILRFPNSNILVGLPIGYQSLNNLKAESKKIWRSQIAWIYPRLKKYLDLNKIYYNASMTRLFIDFIDTSYSPVLFNKIMKIWEDREIVLIEGEKSRLGVGNDLFEKAVKIERILGPAHNAFKNYNLLIQEALKQSKDKLILVAMGPTAKILVYDLSLAGYQAIDIGNLDIEYEWYLRGAKEKTKIPGKYTSEAAGGRIVEDIDDISYNRQIIKRII